MSGALLTGRPRAPHPARELADALERVTRELRSGASLTTALARAVDTDTPVHAATRPSTAPLARVVADTRRGVSLPEALRTARDQCDDPHAPLALAVLEVCARHGGHGADALQRTADTLRERAALHDEGHAQAASARMSMQVLTWIPLAAGALAAATDTRVRHVLLDTPIGIVCLAVGVGLNALGRRWTRSIMRTVDGDAP
jgi:tight adherence protein B